MVMPEKKLMRKMILVGIDFGSNQLPWAIQEPQITSQELRGEKEPGLILFSCPKRYATVIKVEIVRRRKRTAIQREAENGSRKVNQFISKPGNFMKNLVATLFSPGEKWTALLLVSVMNKLARPMSTLSSTSDPITPLHFPSFPKAPYCLSLEGWTIVVKLSIFSRTSCQISPRTPPIFPSPFLGEKRGWKTVSALKRWPWKFWRR